VLVNPLSTEPELHHAQWMEHIRKIVFSKTIADPKWNNTRLIKENIKTEVIKLKQQPGRNMLIFGSPRLTHSFMQWNLIDEYRVNVNPVILGKGVSLFKNIECKVNLQLLSAKKFNAGVVGLHYKTKCN
jgi:dihydrofolate reductase